MTDPGRYDRPDPCDDCGQPHRGDCWPDVDDPRFFDWDADDLGLRVVRDLDVKGDRL